METQRQSCLLSPVRNRGNKKCGNVSEGGGWEETLKTGPREKDGPPGSEKGCKHSLTACDFCQTADRLAEDLFV